MSYLNREQRKEMILTAAMQLALAEGFHALTVRRIATEANVSTGQVHHHFQSTSHLKAAVFIALMDQFNDLAHQIDHQTWYQRISLALGRENIAQIQPYLRLWNEVDILIEHDEEMKQAYKICMQRWHEALSQLIHQGITTQEFKISTQTSPEDIAWRLIVFVCGLDGVYSLNLEGLNTNSFEQHINFMIHRELFQH